MSRADSEPVESRGGRQRKPSGEFARRKFPLPKPFDSWAIQSGLARRHESAEIDQRLNLLQGEPRTARLFDDLIQR